MKGASLSVAFLTSARAWRGSGVSFAHIAHGLLARGHRVQMLAGDDPVVEAFAQRGLAASRIPTGETGLLGARELARSLRSVDADCLVVDRPRDLRLGALSSLAYPVTLVNRYNSRRRRPPLDLLSRVVYRWVGLTIFVSETSARQALAGAKYLRSRPYQVIPEAVGSQFRPDSAAAAHFRAAYGLKNRQFVLAVGSLTADKRYDFLFNALKCLGPDAPLLVICGAGPLAEQLRENAAGLQLDVRFLGLVSPEQLPGAYTAATVLIHACEIETFGLCVLEAMACGLPVLAVDGGAVPEVLGGAGVLSPPNDPAAFAARLRELLCQDRHRELVRVAALRRAGTFSLGTMQEAHAEAIMRVCSADQLRKR